MPSLSERIRNLIWGVPNDPAERLTVPVDDVVVERLMHLLCETRDDELSCEEVFARLDEYVDCLMSRRSAGEMAPLLEHHLALCPDCHDALDALRRALDEAESAPGLAGQPVDPA